MKNRRTGNVHSQANGHSNGGWPIDRRIPLAFVAFLFMQTAAAAWWASGHTHAMAGAQSDIKALQADVRMLQSKNDRLAVVETKLEAVVKSLERLEASLSQRHGRPRS